VRRLVYLVQRRNRTHGLREVMSSLDWAPGARMYLLTWEDLDQVLQSRREPPWIDDLRRFLFDRKLVAFRGFRAPFDATAGGLLSEWRTRARPHGSDFRTAFLPERLPLLRQLALGDATPSRDASNWKRVTSATSLPRLRLLAHWRNEP
jgi:hypothetical protein